MDMFMEKKNSKCFIRWNGNNDVAIRPVANCPKSTQCKLGVGLGRGQFN